SLLFALLLLFSAMLFPFAMFALNLNPWMNAIPFVLMAASFYYFRDLVVLIDGTHHQMPSYSPGFSASKI
ncbi:MAG: hypothetical protein AABX78_01525, partial [Nanoarchaeota archaeon]